MVGHCKDTLQLGSVRIPCGWALQRYLVVGHCKHTLRLGTTRILCGWALQGDLVVGHCRDSWWLVTKVSPHPGEFQIPHRVARPAQPTAGLSRPGQQGVKRVPVRGLRLHRTFSQAFRERAPLASSSAWAYAADFGRGHCPESKVCPGIRTSEALANAASCPEGHAYTNNSRYSVVYSAWSVIVDYSAL